MVSKQNGVWMFTGTTRSDELAEEIKRRVSADDDLDESELIRDAVREYLGQ